MCIMRVWNLMKSQDWKKKKILERIYIILLEDLLSYKYFGKVKCICLTQLEKKEKIRKLFLLFMSTMKGTKRNKYACQSLSL